MLGPDESLLQAICSDAKWIVQLWERMHRNSSCWWSHRLAICFPIRFFFLFAFRIELLDMAPLVIYYAFSPPLTFERQKGKSYDERKKSFSFCTAECLRFLYMVPYHITFATLQVGISRALFSMVVSPSQHYALHSTQRTQIYAHNIELFKLQMEWKQTNYSNCCIAIALFML